MDSDDNQTTGTGSGPDGPVSADTARADAAAAAAAAAEQAEPAPASRSSSPLEVRLLAVTAAARFHGAELDREDLRIPAGTTPPPAALVEWVRSAGLWARATRLNWRNLVKLQSSGPVVLLLNDGSAALMVRTDANRNIVWLRNPAATIDEDGVAVDELRLSQVWSGETILIRAQRSIAEENEPFSFAWIGRLVWLEKRTLRDVAIASVVLSILAILPPLLVMVVIDKVITYQSLNTLTMIALILALAAIYETYLGYARRQLIQIVATKLDAKLSLHIFRRLLGLPIDYFERTQTGAVMYQIGQTTKIRDFITGKLLSTMLDLITLMVLLPVLFWLNVTLTWMVIACAGLIALVIAVFLKPIRRVYNRWMAAEILKNTTLVETVHGIRTVKSLALEPQQRDMWDRRSAEAATWRRALGDMSNWPQTIVTPIEVFMQRGVLLVGCYIGLSDPNGSAVALGGLIAFMMLSNRISSPLVQLARLLEDLEETRGAVGMVANVLNNRPETTTPGAGLRPRFEGAITFNKVDFAYPGSRQKALEDVSFSIPAGTILGLVGRSGSGKSTITRLLQGINREYEGQIKIDTSDLREINLSHLRRSFGVVLQDNFLFRGAIKDNIIAGRPGLTLTDAVRAARLAGAEEFIERLPQGYETVVEEGSPNLSGGQKQRLAIARALIHDPRILILDEATSALDPESEALVNANINRIAYGRTMVIVSHRLSSLTECDQILVLERGKVADIGPHLELVERCPVYRQLWLQQNRHLDTHRQSNTPKPVLAPGD